MLKQSPSLCPLMKKFIALFQVAGRAGENKVIGVIGPTASDGNNMIDMVLSQSLATIIAFLALSLELLDDISVGVVTRSAFLACFTTANAATTMCITIFGLCPALPARTENFGVFLAAFFGVISYIFLVLFSPLPRIRVLFLFMRMVIGTPVRFGSFSHIGFLSRFIPYDVGTRFAINGLACFACRVIVKLSRGFCLLASLATQFWGNISDRIFFPVLVAECLLFLSTPPTKRHEASFLVAVLMKVFSSSRKLFFAVRAAFLGYNGIHDRSYLSVITPPRCLTTCGGNIIYPCIIPQISITGYFMPFSR